MLKYISKNALLLATAAAACVLLVASVNQLTAPKIAEQIELEKLKLLQEVLPAGAASAELLQDCLVLQQPTVLFQNDAKTYRWRQNGELRAYVIETTAPDGYSGNIQLLAAITPDGTVLGVRTLSHKETPGLGDKIEMRKSSWMDSFRQKKLQSADDRRFAVKKDGGQFDQFTGATITPRAVVAAVKRTALYLKQHPELADLPANCQLQ
ncbi:MAG: electron transport complex subunit RsxG [Gammaproteobacteria bacterium]|jgi:Na+-translocating ferredoxin:NAD+ oxidoreductase subunit G|nr:electron transport complex subunit RsxG [Gammaproteobacteria bacterium]MBU2179786.1 electron transport complex subunit RsxG [Gammaproteobacteria bacterium]MBU2427665.1 electron transport complex subunit RsxG [Gammaproteobacteria bacterium]